jgi:hypothetical protein
MNIYLAFSLEQCSVDSSEPSRPVGISLVLETGLNYKILENLGFKHAVKLSVPVVVTEEVGWGALSRSTFEVVPGTRLVYN